MVSELSEAMGRGLSSFSAALKFDGNASSEKREILATALSDDVEKGVPSWRLQKDSLAGANQMPKTKASSTTS